MPSSRLGCLLSLKTANMGNPRLVEPLFAFLKNQLGAQRLTLRGMNNVKAEWIMLATAFNLKTLWRVWRHQIVLNRACI